MKYVSFEKDGRASYGIVRDDGIVDLGARYGDRYPTLRTALDAGVLAELAESGTPLVRRDEVRLLPPVPDPRKIICIGLNYRAHVGEGGGALPDFPSLFTRFADTLVPDGGAIVVPKVSRELDYECELALVIGRGGRHIPVAEAMDHVFGYSCFNDASVRDYQEKHSLPAGKNFHATGGFGPWLVSADEIRDPGTLDLCTRVNGVELQHGNTGDLIFDIPAIISYVSGFTPLSPGDVISTGTPEGVGFVRTPPIFLKPGDVVEIEVEGIGILRNPVVAEDG
ncbi:MAG: fumarylacetoacetate hydrolase family protein [Bauldia sp.]|nr:fumarylacetoacetate hydrolase family protein [Bauldia sp.]